MKTKAPAQGSHLQVLEKSAEQALFEGIYPCIVATVHANERPLHGLAGILDWRFHGAISHGLKSGIMSGREGECTYLPVTRAGRTYHLILVGAGHSDSPGKRESLSEEALKKLSKNIKSLGLPGIGLSRADLGNPPSKLFDELAAKGAHVWLAP